MRFLPLVLLLAAAILSGCGGDGSAPAPTPSLSSSVNYPGDQVGLASFSANFDAPHNGSTPSPAYVEVGWDRAAYISVSQTGAMFRHEFTENVVDPLIPRLSGWLMILPAAPTDVGSFTGTITVNACSNASRSPCNHVYGSPKTISVTYNVRGLSVAPEQLTFSSTGTNPQVQTATLTASAGSPAYTWQVSYSPSVADWLQVTPSGGAPDLSRGPQTLTFNVNAAGFAAGVYSATVTFSSEPKFRAPIVVTLFVGGPSVNFVAPYVVPASAGGNVIIRGRGFSALNPSGLSVQFNSTPALSATLVSDTEIRATYPPLPAGSYSISVSSGGTSIPSRAALKLVVIDPPTSPLTTIPRPASAGWPYNLIYDAERQALLFVDPANQRILRYALSGSGSTSLDTGEPVGQLALSPDGTELIRAGETLTQLVRLDPTTLAVFSAVDVSPLRFGWQSRVLGSSWNPGLAFANDGGAFAIGTGSDRTTRLYRYDMLTHAFTPVSSQWDLSNRPIIASADGGMLVLPPLGQEAFPRRVYAYDASTGALTPRLVTPDWFWFAWLRVNRNASRIIIADLSRDQTTVYDAEFKVLGTLTRPYVPLPFVLSPNGNFAYAYSSAEGRVRKFNVGGSSGITEVGSGSVVAPANTQMAEMTISPDGGTLFLVGQTSVVITPAP